MSKYIIGYFKTEVEIVDVWYSVEYETVGGCDEEGRMEFGRPERLTIKRMDHIDDGSVVYVDVTDSISKEEYDVIYYQLDPENDRLVDEEDWGNRWY